MKSFEEKDLGICLELKLLLQMYFICFPVPAQKIHTSSETYLALMKDNAYELQLRGEIEVKVMDTNQFLNF